MIQAAIMGFGTVGSGVAEVLDKNAAVIARRAGEPIELKYILDLRDFPDSPYADKVIHQFETIESDPSVRLVAECMGGVGAARNFVRRCLAAGKHVVTSNKELVAAHGQELLELAREHHVSFLFEASVGGGIPILRPLTDDLGGNVITDICGILNGTTNYILTKMSREGAAFDAVLRQAQQMGYAEANPAADIDGHDACRKLCILADLAYGRAVLPEQVPTAGITGVTAEDMSFAAAAGLHIKLIARAKLLPDGRVWCCVSPHLLPGEHLLASVDGVFNAVLIHGNAVDDVLFYGRGAGKLATASAVVGDLIDCARHLDRHKDIGWAAGDGSHLAPADALPQRWYIRTAGAPLPGCTALPAAVLGQSACLTPPMPRAAALELLDGSPALSIFPVLE